MSNDAESTKLNAIFGNNVERNSVLSTKWKQIELYGLQSIWRLTARLEESLFHRRTRQVTQVFSYLLTHNLHSMMPSVTCLRLSDDSVICLVADFQFPIQSDFFRYIEN